MGVAYFDKSLSHSDLEGKAHQVIRNNIINMTKKTEILEGCTMAGIDNFCPKIIMHRVFVRCNKMQKKKLILWWKMTKNCHKKEIVC